jgi:hypothetical protein
MTRAELAARRGVAAPLSTARPPMSLGWVLLIVLILVLVGVIPTWPYSGAWGYGPSGLVGLVLVIVLILILTGRI